MEIVRRLYTAVANGDTSAVLSCYDPEVEWDARRSPIFQLGGDPVYRGHEGIKKMTRDWSTVWESIQYELDELIDAGEHVISVLSYQVRGRGSGAEVEHTDYPVWTIREGRIVRVIWLHTRAEALESAGLSKE